MGAIPSSDLPGHKLLHERVVLALERCQESQDVEFKESATWDAIRWKITRTAQAMGNLRDGGVIIIGVSERNDHWKLRGVAATDLETYDPDIIADHLNKYGSPAVELDIVTVKHNGFVFLALQAREFASIPYIAIKNTPDGLPQNETIQVGDVFIRPPGKPQTIRFSNASHMRDLLDLAGEKRARMILETGRRVGMVPSQTASKQYDDELEGL